LLLQQTINLGFDHLLLGRQRPYYRRKLGSRYILVQP
jgi:hypothetical protein